MNAFETSLGIGTIELFKQFLKKKLDEEENKKERHQFVKTFCYYEYNDTSKFDQTVNDILEKHKEKHIKIIDFAINPAGVFDGLATIVFEEDK